jgi:tetratricopeptide (TPR) repeat protein
MTGRSAGSPLLYAATLRGCVIALAGWTAAATLTGCGPKVLAHPAPSIEKSRAPRGKSATETPRGKAATGTVLEAREQAQLAPAEPYWPLRLGELYLAADSTGKAEAALKASLQRDHFYAPALSLLSKLYFQSGRHQEAIEMLEAARSQPDRFPGGFPPELLAGLALHYDALDRTDAARGLMAGLPRNARRGTGTAQVYLALRGEAPDSATDLAETMVRDRPKSAASQNNYGITRLRSGDPESARRAFLEAIEIDPRLPGPYYNLAILEKFYLFDDAAAARWFARYRERSSLDPDGLAEALGASEKKLAEKKETP